MEALVILARHEDKDKRFQLFLTLLELRLRDGKTVAQVLAELDEVLGQLEYLEYLHEAALAGRTEEAEIESVVFHQSEIQRDVEGGLVTFRVVVRAETLQSLGRERVTVLHVIERIQRASSGGSLLRVEQIGEFARVAQRDTGRVLDWCWDHDKDEDGRKRFVFRMELA